MNLKKNKTMLTRIKHALVTMKQSKQINKTNTKLK